jgi:hypothetical protein
MVRRVEAAGGALIREAQVEGVLIERGRAAGVAVSDARAALASFGAGGGKQSGQFGAVREVRARLAVISDVGAANTFAKLLPAAALEAYPALAAQAAQVGAEGCSGGAGDEVPSAAALSLKSHLHVCGCRLHRPTRVFPPLPPCLVPPRPTPAPCQIAALPHTHSYLLVSLGLKGPLPRELAGRGNWLSYAQADSDAAMAAQAAAAPGGAPYPWAFVTSRSDHDPAYRARHPGHSTLQGGSGGRARKRGGSRLCIQQPSSLLTAATVTPLSTLTPLPPWAHPSRPPPQCWRPSRGSGSSRGAARRCSSADRNTKPSRPGWRTSCWRSTWVRGFAPAWAVV